MAIQASACWEKGIRWAIALAIGCAPRVATLPVNGARDAAPAATSAAGSALLVHEEVSVEYWVQKDDPSRPCPDGSVGTDRCVLVPSEAVNPRGPRFWRCDEPRDPAPETLELVQRF